MKEDCIIDRGNLLDEHFVVYFIVRCPNLIDCGELRCGSSP
jgi:hypothetical protein